MPISIIIPTYTAYQYLELCLESILLNQKDSTNEIVIVVDGTYHLNESIVKRYKKLLNIKEVIFDQNIGLATATNHGFYNAINELCLLINDDNVCPKYFDQILLDDYNSMSFIGDHCLVPNQIEPNPSIFRPFIIQNFGEDYHEFDLVKFIEEEQKLRDNKNNLGWTLPIFIAKEIFLAIGGWDISYDSPYVVDWDFFVKLDKLNIPNRRTHKCNFYHFGSKSARTTDSYQKEAKAHEYFRYKWGFDAYNRLLQ